MENHTGRHKKSRREFLNLLETIGNQFSLQLRRIENFTNGERATTMFSLPMELLRICQLWTRHRGDNRLLEIQ